MTDWTNHPHWTHESPDPGRTLPAPRTTRLQAFLQREHLPSHPAGPMALIAIGGLLCWLAIDLFTQAPLDERGLRVVGALIGLAFLVPGLGMVVGGTLDLGRGAWRFRHGAFQPRARERT